MAQRNRSVTRTVVRRRTIPSSSDVANTLSNDTEMYTRLDENRASAWEDALAVVRRACATWRAAGDQIFGTWIILRAALPAMREQVVTSIDEQMNAFHECLSRTNDVQPGTEQ